jgi:glycine oxidase
MWPEWLERVRSESGQEVELSDWGTLFADLGDDESHGWAQRMGEALAALGVPHEKPDREEIHRRVPQLAREAAGGLHLRQERRVHNGQACRAAAEACRRAGVELLEEAPVTRVDLGREEAHVESPAWSGAAGTVVLAAGAWSGGISGLPAFPVRPRRGQMLRYTDCAWPWTGCLRAGRRYAVRRGADELLVGSTVEDVGFDKSTTPEILEALRGFAENLLPPLRDRRPAGAWAGLRPGSADDLPLLGRWGDTALWLATGHFRSGILLAPWSARRLAAWLTGSEAEGDHLFSPDRAAVAPASGSA